MIKTWVLFIATVGAVSARAQFGLFNPPKLPEVGGKVDLGIGSLCLKIGGRCDTDTTTPKADPSTTGTATHEQMTKLKEDSAVQEPAKAATVSLSPKEDKVTKAVNEMYTVRCETHDGSLDAIWTDPNGKVIPVSDISRIRVKQIEGKGLQLELNSILLEDAGTYKCSSANEVSFELETTVPILFNSNLDEQTAYEGEKYGLRCLPHSPSSVMVKTTWKVDGKDITGENDEFELNNFGGLFIKKAKASDADRTFTCVASVEVNGTVHSNEKDIKLQVITKPDEEDNKDKDKDSAEATTDQTPSFLTDNKADGRDGKNLDFGGTGGDCVCENGNGGRNDDPITVNGINIELIYQRQAEIMAMQAKTMDEVKRIADLLYAVQYGQAQKPKA
jgi:hypothetical protein